MVSVPCFRPDPLSLLSPMRPSGAINARDGPTREDTYIYVHLFSIGSWLEIHRKFANCCEAMGCLCSKGVVETGNGYSRKGGGRNRPYHQKGGTPPVKTSDRRGRDNWGVVSGVGSAGGGCGDGSAGGGCGGGPGCGGGGGDGGGGCGGGCSWGVFGSAVVLLVSAYEQSWTLYLGMFSRVDKLWSSTESDYDGMWMCKNPSFLYNNQLLNESLN